MEILTPLPNQSISGDIKELEEFFDRQAGTCLKSKNDKKDNVSIRVYQQLFCSQEEQIKSQREFIFFFSKRTGKDGLHLLDDGKQISADNFDFNVNGNFLVSRTFHPNVHLTAT